MEALAGMRVPASRFGRVLERTAVVARLSVATKFHYCLCAALALYRVRRERHRNAYRWWCWLIRAITYFASRSFTISCLGVRCIHY